MATKRTEIIESEVPMEELRQKEMEFFRALAKTTEEEAAEYGLTAEDVEMIHEAADLGLRRLKALGKLPNKKFKVKITK